MLRTRTLLSSPRSVEVSDFLAAPSTRSNNRESAAHLLTLVHSMPRDSMVFAKTPFKWKQAMPEILENADANLTPRMRNLVSLLWSEWKDLEEQIVAMNEEVEQIASSDPACQRLRQIPGIGPLVATAIVVPRQHSTGGKARLYGRRSVPGWMVLSVGLRSRWLLPQQPTSWLASLGGALKR
jgi:hypothetical protein